MKKSLADMIQRVRERSIRFRVRLVLGPDAAGIAGGILELWVLGDDPKSLAGKVKGINGIDDWDWEEILKLILLILEIIATFS